MSALLRPAASLRPMRAADVESVMAIERSAYSFPWTRGNFIDSLAAGYLALLLLSDTAGIVGYCVALHGVDEMHLLNLTVAPAQQRRGYSRPLLDALEQSCRELGAAKIWLEVRASNQRARELYARRGFAEVGLRRGYYPAGAGRREDAIVMSCVLSDESRHGMD